MRKNFLMYSLHLLCIGLLLSQATVQAAVWAGGPQAANVVDEDLSISGDNSLVGGIQIRADTVDVTVTVSLGDAIVRGDATGPSRLFLCAAAGLRITFDLQDSLSFFGSANGTPLLILVDGGGLVEFVLSDEESVVFSADGLGGGTKFYLMMRQSDPSPVLFRRNDITSDEHVYVIVGRDSIISYVAETDISSNPQETGTITFDPTNTGAGRMILRVQNRGAVLIGGNLIDSGLTKPNIFLSDIDMTVLAGLNARMEVVNSDDAAEHAGLLVWNENTIYPSLATDPFCTGSFDGFRAGFILSSHASLNIGEGAYVDYVGTETNTCLSPAINPEVLDGNSVSSVIKPRNASAFIVDSDSTLDPDVMATINFATTSALFFRSGVDKNGNVTPFDLDDNVSFVIDPALKTPGMGNIVFDVEGTVNFVGADLLNRTEILSLHVQPTGGPVDYVTNSAPFVFPVRDFNGQIYNCASFLVNGRINFISTILAHTDECHVVKEKNDCVSEPTYVGGELLDCEGPSDVRPKMAFYSSFFDLHTSAAVSGLDLFVPNRTFFDEINNVSAFRFFYNGAAFDDCTGRQLILGTAVGSVACDGCTVISRDAHLDIYQEVPQDPAGLQILTLETLPNNDLIHENLPTDIENQFSLHTIYLGWASNISIGTNGDTILGEPLTTFPALIIDGNYFSFETRGGLNNTPCASNVTGQGGIFVDNHGSISIAPTRRANIGTMVTRSHNGSINLPKQQVFFDLRVGIAEWNLDLTDPAQREIIAVDEVLSDYTLNWLATKKDYANFMPYDVGNFDPCACPPVTRANISSLPIVSGTIDQFQIKGSRIGCPAHIMVDCGWIRELVFLQGCNSGEAPTAVVVLQNEGRVGLNMANTSNDSLSATMKLGVNGVTIIANGTGQVDLNSDIVIDNICSVLKGPDFVSTDTLTFFSYASRTIRVKPTGILDLSQFTSGTIRFEGDIDVVFEPGAKLVMGGATLQFFDTCQFIVEPFFGCEEINPELGLQSTNDRRVRVIGTGIISLEDSSAMQISRRSYLGIETDVTCTVTLTDITLQLIDDSQVNIGEDYRVIGGVFQVGNVTDQFVQEGQLLIPATVNFSLIINGENINFRLGSRAFLGLGVGVVDDRGATQNEWLVDNLFNVDTINISIENGSLVHNHIFAGDDERAALIALGQVRTGYNFDIDPIDGEILGGGNIITLVPAVMSPINPTVLNVDGQINERLSASVISSSPLLFDIAALYKPLPPANASLADIFTFLKVADTGTTPNIRASAGRDDTNSDAFLITYVSNGQIIRRSVETAIDPNGAAVAQADRAVSIGAVQLAFPGEDPQNNNDGPIAFEIPQIGSSQIGA